MTHGRTPIREYAWQDEESIRRDVIASGRPAVLRGLVAGWRAVARARESPAALVQYLGDLDTGRLVDAIMIPPEAGQRIFYSEGMGGFNFLRNRLALSAVAEQVLRYAAFPRPPAVAAQSALISDCMPGFGSENRLTLLAESVLPRIWLGNALITPTHVDEWCNMACVICGRRRFTLFPPEQIANLYVGPLDFAPTGAPLSLVELNAPDFQRFPKFRTALAAAQVAELGPGDALFIPPLWWHNVESLEAVNVLVNYWWHAGSGGADRGASAFDCLLHCI
ncbi:MAG TPA: cupin-like domain-containing protein, partial [Steroidobacteraceae bacterium]